jgi:hypothetical protein
LFLSHAFYYEIHLKYCQDTDVYQWNVNKTKVFSEKSNQTPEKVQDGETLGEVL